MHLESCALQAAVILATKAPQALCIQRVYRGLRGRRRHEHFRHLRDFVNCLSHHLTRHSLRVCFACWKTQLASWQDEEKRRMTASIRIQVSEQQAWGWRVCIYSYDVYAHMMLSVSARCMLFLLGCDRRAGGGSVMVGVWCATCGARCSCKHCGSWEADTCSGKWALMAAAGCACKCILTEYPLQHVASV